MQAQGADGDEAIAEYFRALELYRGEYLAPAYYEWVTPERSRLAGLYEEAVFRLSEQLLETGRVAEAARSAWPSQDSEREHTSRGSRVRPAEIHRKKVANIAFAVAWCRPFSVVRVGSRRFLSAGGVAHLTVTDYYRAVPPAR